VRQIQNEKMPQTAGHEPYAEIFAGLRQPEHTRRRLRAIGYHRIERTVLRIDLQVRMNDLA
jgi:hypothetical protein